MRMEVGSYVTLKDNHSRALRGEKQLDSRKRLMEIGMRIRVHFYAMRLILQLKPIALHAGDAVATRRDSNSRRRYQRNGGTGVYSSQISMGRPQKPGVEIIGTLDLLILSRLARGSMHGFGIAEDIHRVSDALHVEEGSLYPALHRLESQGLIESEWGVSENNRRARFYRLTPRGQKQIRVEVSNWRRLVAAINQVIDPLEP